MQLSIIIVNYNVKYFLSQCLQSVFRAIEGMEAEVIVVDNNSQDGSQEMLRKQFGEQIIFIENKDNPGFSKANNQGIAISKGKYVLLLNPDTVVGEETFRVCVDFMEQHPDGGGLGVKMIDGTGTFLPESKRALPSPWVSFCKIFGLSALFPKSPTFARYHLSYLDRNENHEVEILSGAFMLMRKDLLDRIGYLDETFFMYGEDVDLSYRIVQAGYKNYYLADTQIIHYKGESTKKGSLNYVRVFYQAMVIFAKKHFGGSQKQAFILMIQLAVYLRAMGAVLFRFFQKFGFALLESALFYTAIWGIKEYWESNIKYIQGGEYPEQFDFVAAPVYTLVFVLALWLLGAYKKPYSLRPLILGTLFSFIGIATFSYIFPHLNYSRAIVGLSSIAALLISICTRGVQNWREKGNFFFSENRTKYALIVGSAQNATQIRQFVHKNSEEKVEILGYISDQEAPSALNYLGKIQELDALLQVYQIQELIFAQDSLSSQDIIAQMARMKPNLVTYKIAVPHCQFIVAPHSIQIDKEKSKTQYRLAKNSYLKQKKQLNFVASLILLLLFPFLALFYKQIGAAFSAIWQSLLGKRHLVGYHPENIEGLPPLAPSFLHIGYRSQEKITELAEANRFYARNWSWEMELEILLNAWKKLGT